MKRTILLLSISTFVGTLSAQQLDSLQVEPPKVEETTASEEVVIPEEAPLILEEAEESIPVEPSEIPVIVSEEAEEEVETQPSPNFPRRRKGEIKTISGSLGHSGGFGALSFRSTKFRGETLVMAGLRGGWIINRTLAIGLEGHGIIPTAKYGGLSTFEAVAVGGYGGLFLEPIFFSNEVVHVTFPVSAGSGWLGYHEDFDEGRFNDPDLIEGDVFWYIEPGANIEFNLARSFRLALGVSKRFTQDLQLVDTDPKDFNKINYYLTLKIGSF